ncbi:hypothetical protein OF364_02655 [Mycoplasma enhydrae]|uniref:hypothetical protein n=1 Tax=Mycoplasma enhydrae TaxID=2499220 RepID=UPI00197C59AF|nr:hypothetical protein [Mycoplasma enhydrae]MBN4089196.1 hypothetical protein [Mycoplasma enhydrae]MCV3733860.1 hypothetical protein [Mycoplasma enhydrae]MCV3753708.1 hypothetical protein [Mycoplasma enhydrae]
MKQEHLKTNLNSIMFSASDNAVFFDMEIMNFDKNIIINADINAIYKNKILGGIYSYLNIFN